jgi:type I restriction enzyme S subunit
MARAMKESGIAWIGKIPQGWAIKRLKDCVQIELGKMLTLEPKSETDVLLPYIRATNISEKEVRRTSLKEMWFSKAEAIKLKLRNGDVLVAEGGSIGQPLFVSGLTDGENICFQNAANRIRWKNNASFLYFWMSWMYESGFHINNVNVVSISHLTKEKLEVVPIAYPPLSEQRAIADYLDRQTTLIDQRLSVIADKQATLSELRKAIIQEVVTQGLNKSVPMKNAKTEWHGSVPAHWTITRLGSLFREAADAGCAGLPMLTVSIHSGISDKEFNDDELDRKVSRSEDRTLYKRVKPGDLVYNQMRAWQGAFGAAKIEGLVSPAYVVARPGKVVVPSFVEYLMRSPTAMEEIRRRSRGITEFRLRLYWDEFKNIQIALPPLKEQKEIVAHLDRQTKHIDAQLATLDEQVQVLKELRKAIIHEAVTGKIDLSEARTGKE